ncbi:asparagine synthase (glutamine-hydrolyzing) [Candidatus Parcubacteria bacterium]|nr:MAG: asparagine synthase (glutamine-hydrolyzing) [Candidatus Parcubacteria bacterium]
MCGITGFLGALPNNAEETCLRMADRLVNRGPDDGDVWVDENAGVALGHRRLAILDLSLAGHQPMLSASGRYVIAYNGEIYNFLDLRKVLESQGFSFRTHSDTEVLLTAIEAWGIENAAKRCVGMFAFALWDKKERILTLARDRLGEKPLYYGWQGDAFLFASELKAMRAHPAWRGEIDRDALALYLRLNYIPAPYSIYRGICKLPPGTFLRLRANATPASMPVPRPYWSMKQVAESGTAHPLRLSDDEAVDRLDGLLRETIRDKMIADVPLGAFLSGGIDSSTVVAVMQAESSRPVRTFSIGFHERGYNEAEHAKAVARHLGTEHTEAYVSPQEALEVIPRLPEIYDEPFADASQIPTSLLCALTRRHVTVALSGDGGDELFCGYNRYFHAMRLWKTFRLLPGWSRKRLASGIQRFSPLAWDRLYEGMARWLPARLKLGAFGDKMHKLAEVLATPGPEGVYHRLVSHWREPERVVLGGHEPLSALTDRSRWAHLSDFRAQMMYLDAINYLPDDILVKVDRAAMYVSLETRVPLLDHRVVEFAWRLPLSLKIRGGRGKWLLRQVLYKYVTPSLVDRPKMGFGVPLEHWLRGPLRDWAESLLDETRLKNEGFFDPIPIRNKWEEHLSGRRNWQYWLWDVLMFQAWKERERS